MSEFPQLPETGDPDPAGELEVPEQDFLTPEEAEADETIDIDEQE